MTSATAIADRIRTALGRELKRSPDSIELGHALREDLGLNSLDAIELMFKVEEEFDLEIPDADLQALRTVGDLVGYLEGRLGIAGAAPAAPAASAAKAAPAAKRAPAPRTGAKGAKSAKRVRASAAGKRPLKRPSA